MRWLKSVPIAAAFLAAATVSLPDGFDPMHWPGEKPASPAYKELIIQLREAQARHDVPQVRRIALQVQENLGNYAGVPQVKPEYGSPIERGTPDLKAADALCWKAFVTMNGNNAWDIATKEKPYGQPRLRTTTRTVVSDLRAFEAGLPHAQEYRAAGVQGLNYLIAQQASTGVFGYPYNPGSTSNLGSQALSIVRKGESLGRKMVEGAWMIDDGDEGGLQFDNGEAGAALLYGYVLTGDSRYLQAARRAADWAIGRQIVPNWNYNSYSGYLLARMYRVTGERRYLDAASDKFEVGVLPGQMQNGRWVDQHNARPQYHALMIRNLIEYMLALQQAKDPRAKDVRRHIMLALDSLAEEQDRYGASNAEEGLPLEAIAVGLLAFGPNQHWQQAADIQANYAVDYLLPATIEKWPHQGHPEMLTEYLLERKVKENSARSCEIVLPQCPEHKN